MTWIEGLYAAARVALLVVGLWVLCALISRTHRTKDRVFRRQPSPKPPKAP